MGRTGIRRRLNGAALMQLSLCLHVGFMRGLWRLKDAKILALAFADDASNKTTRMPYHAKQTSCAGALGRVLVFGVRSPADLAQVGKGIVGLVAVYVVNLFHRPFASHVQPCEAVRQGSFAVKHDVDVPILAQRPSRHPGLLASVGLQACEMARLWAVMRKLAQTVLCDHVAPHQSGKPSKDAASGDESPVPRRVSCQTILRQAFAKASICGKIKPLRKMRPAASNEKLRCLYGIA